MPAEPQELRRLDRRARMVLSLFAKKDRITAQDAITLLGLSDRIVRVLMQKWVKDEWLVMTDSSKRARSYGLSAKYRQFVGNLTAIDTVILNCPQNIYHFSVET